MKKTVIAALGAVSLMALSACNQKAAADSIEGTWKADLASVEIEEKPDVLVLKDGQYACSSCTPPLAVAADGQFHPVADRPYYDSLSVEEVDAQTVKFARKKGERVVGEQTLQVSPDGNTLTFSYSNSSNPDKPPITGKGTQTRIGAAPAGAHAISGTWQNTKIETVSDEGLVVTYDLEGDTLKMSSASGESYEAKVGGPEVPVQGDIGGTLVLVERIDNGFRETNKRNGKVVGVATVTVGPDGKMTGAWENMEDGSKTRWTATKQ